MPHQAMFRPLRLAALLPAACALTALHAAELHVAPTGNDTNPGTAAAAFRTIQHAAELAQPGDTITVHAGIYRERINPPRGGESDTKRITYQAAPGEKVEIKGSEVVKNWVNVQGDVWKVVIPNTFFGGFNPYSDLIHGDWFNAKGRKHHTGAVYLNGEWLTEAAKLDDVLKPTGAAPFWFAEVGNENTTIQAQFKGVNPNEQLVEINVRQTVFYPTQPGMNYITVRGFALRQAATPWAPPTAEQIGLIGTHWSRGWIIENNEVSHSICSGIALGKHGDQFDNTSANSAEGYVKTIERAHAHAIAWTKENIGHHLVRNNTISHCEQTGIVGSLGCSFSTVTGNTIHDIHVRKLFSGAEMAGIKFHGAIDVEISRNRIYRTCLGMWMDWMAQGTRITGNLCYDNSSDLFLEVNHGPYLVDNNIFLSRQSVLDASEGGAFVHNIIAGTIKSSPQGRLTPYHPAHATAVAGLINIKGADNRFYNNLFIGQKTTDNSLKKTGKYALTGFGLWEYDAREFSLQTGGNVYYNGTRPYAREAGPLIVADLAPTPTLIEKDGKVYLNINVGQSLAKAATVLVTTKLLGKAKIPGVGYENPDGSPLQIDTDYFGNKRNPAKPTPGPFENPGQGDLNLNIWPIKQ